MTKLAVRFLAANRRRNISLGATIAVVVFGGILLESVGRTVIDRLEADAQRRYGTAQITLPGGGAGTLAGGAGWITEDQASRISELLRIEAVGVTPRVQSDAILLSEDQFSIVRILSSADSTPHPAGPQSLLIGYAPATLGDDASSGFVDLGEVGVSWARDQDDPDLVWTNDNELMRALREVGLAPENAVGNVLLITRAGDRNSPDDRSPGVIAYNSAELLITEFPEVAVHSRRDLADTTAEISAKNISLLLVLLLVLPAIAAIIGSVLVIGESRSDELLLLRTMGFDTPTVRALIVREVFLTAAGATLIALVSAGVVAAVAPSLAVTPKSFVTFAVIGGFVPPGLSFLTAKRLLAGKIHTRLAEFRR